MLLRVEGIARAIMCKTQKDFVTFFLKLFLIFNYSYMWYVLRENGLEMLTITINLRQTEQERYLIVPKLVLRDKSVDKNFLVKRNPRKRKAI